jgi:hypothetical protein
MYVMIDIPIMCAIGPIKDWAPNTVVRPVVIYHHDQPNQYSKTVVSK